MDTSALNKYFYLTSKGTTSNCWKKISSAEVGISFQKVLSQKFEHTVLTYTVIKFSTYNTNTYPLSLL